jgi:hypothetical protein
MTDQPPPKKNDGPAVWSLVVRDMNLRDETGFKRYGVRLQPHNGRDTLMDLYEELLDAVAYTKTYMLEAACQKEKINQVLALVAGKEHLTKDEIVKIVSLLS